MYSLELGNEFIDLAHTRLIILRQNRVTLFAVVRHQFSSGCPVLLRFRYRQSVDFDTCQKPEIARVATESHSLPHVVGVQVAFIHRRMRQPPDCGGFMEVPNMLEVLQRSVGP